MTELLPLDPRCARFTCCDRIEALYAVNHLLNPYQDLGVGFTDYEVQSLTTAVHRVWDPVYWSAHTGLGLQKVRWGFAP